MEFRILGPLEVVEHGRALALGGSRQRALLALLLTRANEVVSADRLIDELWGAEPPAAASNALQYHVSQLRKALAPAEVIETRQPGYVLHVAPDDLDLLRFERLVEEAQRAESPDLAARLLHDALGLWRGRALADLSDQPWSQAEINRLEELRLAAIELRIEADLALGRHSEVVGELERLIMEHPVRERLRGLLMRALYASGRQAEALTAYRETRALLVEELGIEPSPALQELEQAILRQDPALAPGPSHSYAEPRQRAIMAMPRGADRLDDLLAIAEPLARRPPRELILARLVSSAEEVAAATTELAACRAELSERGIASRIAAYTTDDVAGDAVLLATQHDADLMLVDAPATLLETGRFDDALSALLAQAPCDVAVLTGGGLASSGPVVTPFGGAEHEWSAIELAAWLAGSLDTSLRLIGTQADPNLDRRDASRLLARASLLLQQVVGIVTEPVLVPSGEEGVLDASRDARLLVIGLSERWRSEGVGPVRRAVAEGAAAPTLFVRRGLRPSGVAPHDTLTRFTWTLASQQIERVDES
jgi:DNA-binding SARP family transcriptional activator